MNNKLKAALITAAVMTFPGILILLGLQFPNVVITALLTAGASMLIYGIYKAIYDELEGNRNVSSKR